MCREAPRRAHEWARRVPPIDRDPLAVRRACDRRFPAPAPDARRSVRLRKYAIFLPPVRQEPPISPRTLIPRPLRVPISRGSNVPRSLLWPRAALRVPISRGTFLPRSVASSRAALAVPISRGTFLPRSLDTATARGPFLSRARVAPRAALAGPISHGTFLPRALVETRGALFAGRGSIGASTSRGTNVPRARDTSICAARVPRASLGLCTAQRRGVPRARTISTARGMLIPRDEPHNTPPFNKAATSAGAATSAASP